MSGGPLGVLYSFVVCLCDELDLERVQPVQAAGSAGQAVVAGGAAPGAEECSPGAAATAGREAEEGSAGEATAELLETESTEEYQGLRRLRMSTRLVE